MQLRLAVIGVLVVFDLALALLASLDLIGLPTAIGLLAANPAALLLDRRLRAGGYPGPPCRTLRREPGGRSRRARRRCKEPACETRLIHFRRDHRRRLGPGRGDGAPPGLPR